MINTLLFFSFFSNMNKNKNNIQKNNTKLNKPALLNNEVEHDPYNIYAYKQVIDLLRPRRVVCADCSKVRVLSLFWIDPNTSYFHFLSD